LCVDRGSLPFAGAKLLSRAAHDRAPAAGRPFRIQAWDRTAPCCRCSLTCPAACMDKWAAHMRLELRDRLTLRGTGTGASCDSPADRICGEPLESTHPERRGAGPPARLVAWQPARDVRRRPEPCVTA